MRIVRRVVVPSLLVVLVVAVIAGVVGGRDALVGAGLGGVLVVAFLGASPGMLEPVVRASPGAALPVAVLFYMVKACVAVVALVVLLDSRGLGSHLSTPAFATAMITVTLAWVFLHALALHRSRTPIYDLG